MNSYVGCTSGQLCVSFMDAHCSLNFLYKELPGDSRSWESPKDPVIV